MNRLISGLVLVFNYKILEDKIYKDIRILK